MFGVRPPEPGQWPSCETVFIPKAAYYGIARPKSLRGQDEGPQCATFPGPFAIGR